MSEPSGADLITPELVRLDASLGADKAAVIHALSGVVVEAGRSSDAEGLAADVLAREETSATGLPGGIAIPHCRTEHVTEPTLAFARLEPKTDFGAKDGPADLVFMILAPADGDATHLSLLTQLARALVKAEFTDTLRSVQSPEELVAAVREVVQPPAPEQAAEPEQAEAPTAPAARKSIVAVTACPTGIAHTYMAAESLEAAAERAGVDIHVETQGSAGSTPLAPEVIEAADAAVFATDVGVKDRARFAGKPLVAAGVKRGIDEPDQMIAEALAYANDPDAPRVEGSAAAPGAAGRTPGSDEHLGLKVRRVLLTGVSYMIPFVAAGGLLIALGFLLGGYEITGPANDIVVQNSLFNLPTAADLDIGRSGLLAYLGAVLFVLGSASFAFLVPALAGYIAYAIADRPGIAPGFTMGFIANTVLQAGFLGGIVGGVLAGLVAHWIASWKIPTWARGLMPVVVIPLGATLVSGFVMIVVLGKPLRGLMSALTDGLNSMTGSSAIVLGIILGLMMAFDMGGPLNKTAYAFATAGLGAVSATAGDAPQLKIMAAVMLAGMVPPLALALATVVRPRLFNQAERENGKAAWLLGASFITEGAIPFAAADPLRVIPSIMAGSAVTGALSMLGDVTLRAPHGGVFVLFAVGNVVWFVISLVAGVLVSAALVVALKSLNTAEASELAEATI